MSHPPGTVGTVATIERFYLRTGNGVALAFCTPEHAHKWCAALPAPTLELTTLDVSTRAITWCEHCAHCGTLISATITGACQLHDGDCPDFEWLATLAVQRAVRALTRMAGVPLTPRAFVYIEDAAQNQWEAGDFPDVADLVKRVWDVRIDWQHPPGH